MKRSNTIGQLLALNELFAGTGASAPDCAEHIRCVLDFVGKTQGNGAFEQSFAESAERLARLHFGVPQASQLKFVHWSLSAEGGAFGPLWIRRALIARMRQLAGSRAAFLLISGVREAICPKGSYWTQKRQDDYDRVCDYINELACAWSTPALRLQVVFFD